jgi:dihydrodipicolinate synthase/N-acetylneuraminate lyase
MRFGNTERGAMKLTGVFTVLQMPLTPADHIDEPVLEREINWLIEFGVNGLVLAMVPKSADVSGK